MLPSTSEFHSSRRRQQQQPDSSTGGAAAAHHHNHHTHIAIPPSSSGGSRTRGSSSLRVIVAARRVLFLVAVAVALVLLTAHHHIRRFNQPNTGSSSTHRRRAHNDGNSEEDGSPHQRHHHYQYVPNVGVVDSVVETDDNGNKNSDSSSRRSSYHSDNSRRDGEALLIQEAYSFCTLSRLEALLDWRRISKRLSSGNTRDYNNATRGQKEKGVVTVGDGKEGEGEKMRLLRDAFAVKALLAALQDAATLQSSSPPSSSSSSGEEGAAAGSFLQRAEAPANTPRRLVEAITGAVQTIFPSIYPPPTLFPPRSPSPDNKDEKDSSNDSSDSSDSTSTLDPFLEPAWAFARSACERGPSGADGKGSSLSTHSDRSRVVVGGGGVRLAVLQLSIRGTGRATVAAESTSHEGAAGGGGDEGSVLVPLFYACEDDDDSDNSEAVIAEGKGVKTRDATTTVPATIKKWAFPSSVYMKGLQQWSRSVKRNQQQHQDQKQSQEHGGGSSSPSSSSSSFSAAALSFSSAVLLSTPLLAPVVPAGWYCASATVHISLGTKDTSSPAMVGGDSPSVSSSEKSAPAPPPTPIRTRVSGSCLLAQGSFAVVAALSPADGKHTSSEYGVSPANVRLAHDYLLPSPPSAARTASTSSRRKASSGQLHSLPPSSSTSPPPSLPLVLLLPVPIIPSSSSSSSVPSQSKKSTSVIVQLPQWTEHHEKVSALKKKANKDRAADDASIARLESRTGGSASSGSDSDASKHTDKAAAVLPWREHRPLVAAVMPLDEGEGEPLLLARKNADTSTTTTTASASPPDVEAIHARTFGVLAHADIVAALSSMSTPGASLLAALYGIGSSSGSNNDGNALVVPLFRGRGSFWMHRPVQPLLSALQQLLPASIVDSHTADTDRHQQRPRRRVMNASSTSFTSADFAKALAVLKDASQPTTMSAADDRNSQNNDEAGGGHHSHHKKKHSSSKYKRKRGASGYFYDNEADSQWERVLGIATKAAETASGKAKKDRNASPSPDFSRWVVPALHSLFSSPPATAESGEDAHGQPHPQQQKVEENAEAAHHPPSTAALLTRVFEDVTTVAALEEALGTASLLDAVPFSSPSSSSSSSSSDIDGHSTSMVQHIADNMHAITTSGTSSRRNEDASGSIGKRSGSTTRIVLLDIKPAATESDGTEKATATEADTAAAYTLMEHRVIIIKQSITVRPHHDARSGKHEDTAVGRTRSNHKDVLKIHNHRHRLEVRYASVSSDAASPSSDARHQQHEEERTVFVDYYTVTTILFEHDAQLIVAPGAAVDVRGVLFGSRHMQHSSSASVTSAASSPIAAIVLPVTMSCVDWSRGWGGIVVEAAASTAGGAAGSVGGTGGLLSMRHSIVSCTGSKDPQRLRGTGTHIKRVPAITLAPPSSSDVGVTSSASILDAQWDQLPPADQEQLLRLVGKGQTTSASSTQSSPTFLSTAAAVDFAQRRLVFGREGVPASSRAPAALPAIAPDWSAVDDARRGVLAMLASRLVVESSTLPRSSKQTPRSDVAAPLVLLHHAVFANLLGPAFGIGRNAALAGSSLLVQDAAQGLECVECRLSLDAATFADFPFVANVDVAENQQQRRGKSASASFSSLFRKDFFVDADNDGVYVRGGEAAIARSVVANALDDGIDSASNKLTGAGAGASAGGANQEKAAEVSRLSIVDTAVHGCQHEGIALSGSVGAAPRTVLIDRSVISGAQQGIENGHSPSSHVAVLSGGTVLWGNQIGLRYGDDYALAVQGQVAAEDVWWVENRVPAVDWVRRERKTHAQRQRAQYSHPQRAVSPVVAAEARQQLPAKSSGRSSGIASGANASPPQPLVAVGGQLGGFWSNPDLFSDVIDASSSSPSKPLAAFGGSDAAAAGDLLQPAALFGAPAMAAQQHWLRAEHGTMDCRRCRNAVGALERNDDSDSLYTFGSATNRLSLWSAHRRLWGRWSDVSGPRGLVCGERVVLSGSGLVDNDGNPLP